jgi:hypothetical protein
MQRKSAKRKPPSQKLRARALAIINNDKYDGDTRASIAFQLKTNYDDLADMVRDAEQGVTICDTVMVQTRQKEAAKQVTALINTPSPLPWFLRDAMVEALQKASTIEGIPLQEEGSSDLNRDAVINLFANSQGLLLRPRGPKQQEKQRVVDATREILSNPQTPGDLFEHVAEFVTETLNKRGDGEDLIFITPLLTVIIGSFPDDESMGARKAARAAAREAEAKEAQS